MRASYRKALLWIAENDEPESLEFEEVRGYVTTLLVADLFGKDEDAVARAIIRRRKARNAQERYEQAAPGGR